MIFTLILGFFTFIAVIEVAGRAIAMVGGSMVILAVIAVSSGIGANFLTYSVRFFGVTNFLGEIVAKKKIRGLRDLSFLIA